VQTLEADRLVTISSPTSYFKFTTTTFGYTVAVSTNLHLDLLVAVMQSVCPTYNLYLEQATRPTNTFYSDDSIIYKYIFTSRNAPPGTYFISVTDTSYTWGAHPISHAYSVSATNGYCPSYSCQFGHCNSHSDCVCYPGYTGTSCGTLVHNQWSHSDSSDHHHDSSSSDHHHDSSSSDHHHHGDDMSGWTIGGIVIGCVVLIAFVIVFIIVVIAIAAIVKKRRKAPRDNIYNLLTTEDPL